MKRAFDIFVAAVLLILLSPVLAATATAVLACMGRPVLFVQLRPGLRGIPFRLVKFRSMRNEVDGAGKPIPDEMRLTRIGSFLRSTSLDELPELWNVLVGDMSLVGPRPLLIDYLERYSDLQRRRHEVRPGVTGWAQINGRNSLSWEERLALDVWYVDHRTLCLDLRILIRTINTVLCRRGIGHGNRAIMPIFEGNHGSSRGEE